MGKSFTFRVGFELSFIKTSMWQCKSFASDELYNLNLEKVSLTRSVIILFQFPFGTQNFETTEIQNN